MTRIPIRSIEDAPQESRALLAEMVQFSPTGQLLNLHAQMAHAPGPGLSAAAGATSSLPRHSPTWA